jgi:hypothetical protein
MTDFAMLLQNWQHIAVEGWRKTGRHLRLLRCR